MFSAPNAVICSVSLLDSSNTLSVSRCLYVSIQYFYVYVYFSMSISLCMSLYTVYKCVCVWRNVERKKERKRKIHSLSSAQKSKRPNLTRDAYLHGISRPKTAIRPSDGNKQTKRKGNFFFCLASSPSRRLFFSPPIFVGLETFSILKGFFSPIFSFELLTSSRTTRRETVTTEKGTNVSPSSWPAKGENPTNEDDGQQRSCPSSRQFGRDRPRQTSSMLFHFPSCTHPTLSVSFCPVLLSFCPSVLLCFTS